MTGPAYLTTREVAELLRIRERKVYDMAAEGAIPHRRVTGKLLFPRSEIEAWLSGNDKPPATQAPPVLAGSHDPLLDWAIRESGAGLATLFDGSLDGLDRLASGQAIAAGLHVFEPSEETWNIATTSARLAGSAVALVQWARRDHGLIVAPGHAAISSVADLAGLRVARRQPAAGSAVLFDHLLSVAGLTHQDLAPMSGFARTETEAASAVASGTADAAPGLMAVANQFGLRFVPMMQERFDLAVHHGAYFSQPFQTLMGFAGSDPVRAKAAEMGGYDLTGLGTVHWTGV